MEKEIDIKGRVVPCPKFSGITLGAGIIDLQDCEKCEYHQGFMVVRKKSEKGLEISEIKCNLPTRIRITYYVSEVG